MENSGPQKKDFGLPNGPGLPVSFDSLKKGTDSTAASSVPRFLVSASNPAQVAYMLTHQAPAAAPPPVSPAVQASAATGPAAAPTTVPANPLQILARPSLPMMDLRPRPTSQVSRPQAASSGTPWFDAVRARVDAFNASIQTPSSTIDITAGDSRVVRAAPPARLKQRVTLDLLDEKAQAVRAGSLRWKAYDDFLGLAKDRLERVRTRLLARPRHEAAEARDDVGQALKGLSDAVNRMQQAARKQNLELLDAALRSAAESDDLLERARALMAVSTTPSTSAVAGRQSGARVA